MKCKIVLFYERNSKVKEIKLLHKLLSSISGRVGEGTWVFLTKTLTITLYLKRMGGEPRGWAGRDDCSDLESRVIQDSEAGSARESHQVPVFPIPLQPRGRARVILRSREILELRLK